MPEMPAELPAPKDHLQQYRFETFDEIEVDNRKIFLSHYPLLAKPMAKSGDYDAVFYGHTHKKKVEKLGKCIVVNPGEIAAHKTDEASYAIYDTKTNSAKLIQLQEPISVKTKYVKKYLNQ